MPKPNGPTRTIQISMPTELYDEFVEYSEFGEVSVEFLMAEALQDYADVVIATRMESEAVDA